MSSVHPPPNCFESTPDLTALASSLQEAAQALLAVSSTGMPIVSKDVAANPAVRQNAGETRSFYFPPGTVHL